MAKEVFEHNKGGADNEKLLRPATEISELLKKSVMETVDSDEYILENKLEEEEKSIALTESTEKVRKRDLLRKFVKEKLQRMHNKLDDRSYLKNKNIAQILKKLLKMIDLLLDADLRILVIRLGHIVGKIVCHIIPLPQLQLHTMGSQELAYVENHVFTNYGSTIENMPAKIFFPKSVADVQHVIQYGKSVGKRVRACGMRHSWTSLFSEDNQILVSLLPLSVTDTLTHVREKTNMHDRLDDFSSDLSFIELKELVGNNQAAVRVGSATTNLEMLKWSLDIGWTLPWDIIAVMITYGGSNATICHGAGLQSQSLSDLVLQLEFVNFNGELQTINDPELLRSAAGCFGLLGIVTALTLRLDKMTYARWQPKKSSMIEAIPKPTQSDAEHFERLCKTSYYTEFFWFPNNGLDEGYWENCFNNDGTETESGRLNDKLDGNYQIATTFLFHVITRILVPVAHIDLHFDPDKVSYGRVLRKLFTKIVSKCGINALPEPSESITTPLVDALHFRQGFHYISVREMEGEIPIPELDGRPDWTFVRKVWWDAVDMIQQSATDQKYGCDMTLEMRVMGSSNSTLAPYRNNKFGTISIEPVSTMMVPKEIWEEFKIRLANKWASYRDGDGSPLKVRFHWAKEFPSTITWNGNVFKENEYAKMMYAEELKEFKQHLHKICSDGGYKLNDIRETFSNSYLDDLFHTLWT